MDISLWSQLGRLLCDDEATTSPEATGLISGDAVRPATPSTVMKNRFYTGTGCRRWSFGRKTSGTVRVIRSIGIRLPALGARKRQKLRSFRPDWNGGLPRGKADDS